MDFFSIKKLLSDLNHYTIAQKNRAEFEVKYHVENARDLISRAIILLTIVGFIGINLFFAILFGFLALAFYINKHDWLGFLVVSGIHFLILFLIIIGTRLFRGLILGRILRMTIHLSEQIYKFFFISKNKQ